jgi:hypothetical protein
MIMVFISAFFAFRRQIRGEGILTGTSIFLIALEVGTLTHFYTFALYLPLSYLVYPVSVFDGELFQVWIGLTLLMGLVSLIMFVWIAVPMHVAVGYVLKHIEKGMYDEPIVLDDTILDDTLLGSDLDTAE